MKIDKRNIRHWFYLCAFALNVLVAWMIRPFFRRKDPKQVIFYGHKLNGNLLAIYRHLRHTQQGIEAVFLTMDPVYHRALLAAGEASALAIAPSSIPLLASADAVISDHGLHALAFMVGRSTIKFFDVWHGIPFKGFDADDFRLQHRYDEVWVASPLMAKLYIERYGFDPAKVKVTGYARTDRLVLQDEDPAALKLALGLDGPEVGKIVLFAPTWKQDAHNRSIYPFGLEEEAFLGQLSALAERCGATIVVRAHLNSQGSAMPSYPRIVQRPHADYPDTEALLLVSDVLVCDWSSIAFDYLLLERPTIFLDVEAPFAKGFSLGAEYRFAAIVADMPQLLHWLQHYLQHPADYQARHGADAARIRHAVYAHRAVGAASARCIARLRHHLDSTAG